MAALNPSGIDTVPVVTQQATPAPARSNSTRSEDVKSLSSAGAADNKDVEAAQPGAEQSKDGQVEQDPGVTRIEALYQVFGRGRAIYLLYLSIGLISYVYSLSGNTTGSYLAFATSAFSAHSLLGAIDVAVSLMGAVSKPFIAKIADITSRPWAYLVAVIFYCVGFAIVAGSKSVNAVAAGELIYTIGNTGIDLVTDIIIADITPLQWRGFVSAIPSAPYIINAFVAGFITDGVGQDGWRWGYGMFCLIVPAAIAPALMILFWADIKAKKIGALSLSASSYTGRLAASSDPAAPAEKPKTLSAKATAWARLAFHFFQLIDGLGLILLGTGWALVLLPFTLYKNADKGWRNPSLIAMFVVGGLILIAFTLWEKYGTSHPVCPRRIFNRTFVCCCIVDITYNMSGNIRSTYYSSWVWVVKDWSLRDWTFFTNTLTVGLCVFGLLAGLLQRLTHSYKIWQIFGLCVRSVGLGLTLHARGANATDAELVWTQILIAIGGGFSVVGSRVASQASVPHADLALSIALLSLFSRIGSAVGSAVAAGVWTDRMPANLAKQLSGHLSAAEIKTIFGSIKKARNQPALERALVIHAYNDTVRLLYIPALCISFISILAACLTRNFRLDGRHNAVEDKMVVREKVGEAVEGEVKREGEKRA